VVTSNRNVPSSRREHAVFAGNDSINDNGGVI